MRWDREKVCFEPGGKDHSSAGGSYDTAKSIVAKVYGWTAPQYVGYDFVSIKGSGGKISSSSGGVVTVSDCLEIYEPRVLRWLFASYRPNTEFQISFDLDVIKIYEDYDRAMRLAHEAEDGGRKDKKRRVARRTLELSSIPYARIEPGSTLPRQPGFRHLSMVLQIFDGDLEAAGRHYESVGEIETEQEHELFRARARCVWTWIEKYAPQDFRYRIREAPVTRKLDADERTALGRLVDCLSKDPPPDEPELSAHLKTLCENTSLDLKKLSPLLYDLLIARDHGPRLSTLLCAMGPARALPLLRGGLG
jgi:lysyl-tRNA synthetase class 1